MRWFGITLLIIMLVNCSAFAQSDYPEWPVYTFDDPMTAALEPTGLDLHWSSAQPVGTTRLFLSNHPESIDASVPEGKLWTEEVSTPVDTTYRLFLQHYNNSPLTKKFFIGVTVENLSPGGDLTISGEYISTPYQSANNTRDAWIRLKEVGKRNAFSELSGKLRTTLPAVIARKAGGETLIIRWPIQYGSMLGLRMWLRVRRTHGSDPIKFRLSTVYTRNEQQLTHSSTLIPVGVHHPRGSWSSSELTITNSKEVFDIGPDERDRRTVRMLRICQPVYVNGVKVRYTDEVIYTRSNSTNPTQSLSNNGLYGVVVNAFLCVKNSGTKDSRVGIYLRYPVKELEGTYVGAATTYAMDETTEEWRRKETKAVDLSRLSYDNSLKHVDWWWYTHCLASYLIKAGTTLEIPLTLTNDGPAMLPLGIVLRKEPVA